MFFDGNNCQLIPGREIVWQASATENLAVFKTKYEKKTFMLEVRFLRGVRMAARRKVAGLALVITGIIVILTSSVVIAGEETLGPGFIVQVLVGVAVIVEGVVLLVLPRKRP